MFKDVKRVHNSIKNEQDRIQQIFARKTCIQRFNRALLI